MADSCDLLLTNAAVLTMDVDYNIYEPGAIAIRGESILAVGPEEELRKRYSPVQVNDCQGRVVMPWLVNAHTHVPMTLLRGLADDLRLDVWLLGYMMPVEREFVSPDFVDLGTRLACLELIRSGVTSFADMYYFEDSVARATSDVGLRAICSQTVMKFPTPDAGSFEESMAMAREFIIKWKDHPLIVPSVAPHAPYTCTEEIFRLAAALAVEFDVPLHTHLAETAVEVENLSKEKGLRVVPYVEQNDLFDAKVLAAHCVHVEDSEMHILHNHKAGVAHNPSSNLKLASGIAPIARMIEMGLNVGIGTDGPASNNEVRLAAFLAKTASNDPTALPARTALAMATRLGAKAMHIGDITGSLEAGKRADLILVDLSRLHNLPRFRRESTGLYAQLVYASKSTDVTDVMVNGRWLMQNHHLTSINETDLLMQAQEYAHRIDTFLIQREKSVLSKLVALSTATEEESFEVQAKVRIPDPAPVLAALTQPGIEILRKRHYHEYDTYFLFDDPEQSVLRHREDEFINEKSQVSQGRYRLTLIGQNRGDRFSNAVLLSRSRYLAPAAHSLRFYREYFKPRKEIFIEKDRQRWRVLFRGTEFYVNLDRVDQPPIGTFLEVKSRTWSRRDAEHKSQVAKELLAYLGAGGLEPLAQDYLELVNAE